MSNGSGPLAGVRVLEMGRLIAAPFCAQTLGDLGAEVIKIERVGTGDDARGYGPPFLNGKDGLGAESVYYLSYNRNKRSIAIDFSKPEGADLIRKLAAECDVFIENYKVGSLKKYGLDEASIRAANPEIIYLSLSGFGQTGPYASRPATDVVIQGMSGLMSVTGEPDGDPNRVGVPVADMMTGLYCVIAIISSLYEKSQGKTGGSWPKVALLDCGMALMNSQVVWNALAGRPPMRAGNDAQGSTPSGLFATRNGQILIQAGKDADFQKLCKVLGREDIAADPKFALRANRVTRHGEIQGIIADEFAKWDRTELYDGLVKQGIICGPVNLVNEALADPQVINNGIEQLAGHPDDPGLKLVGSPIRFGDDVDPIHRYPPRMGEHGEEVLRELLGLDGGQIAELSGKQVIQLR
jgi:crotonobetainyl-CoA:carnitine CoA-transferase CaiB-like acyl-CoA transferase